MLDHHVGRCRRAAPGQWEASFCRGRLNPSVGATGLATFGYWGVLTAVRISLTLVPRPVPPGTSAETAARSTRRAHQQFSYTG